MKSAEGNKGKRFWLIFVGFALIPAALIMLGWNFLTEEQLGISSRQQSSMIRRELRDLRRESADQVFLQKRLNTLFGMLAEEELTAEVIEFYLAALRAEGLGFIRLRFFDGKREMLKLKGGTEKNRVIVQRIFEALVQPETEGESRLLERYKSFFDGFVGGIPVSEIANDKSSLMRVTTGGKPGFFYWNTFYNRWDNESFAGGMVAYYLDSEVEDGIGLKTMIRIKNLQASDGRFFGLADLNSPQHSIVASAPELPAGFNIHDLCQTIKLMRRDFLTETTYAGKLLSIEQFDSTRLVYCIADIGQNGLDKVELLLRICVLLLLLVVGRLGFVSMSMNADELKQILERFGLAYAVVIPLLAFFLIGFQYVVAVRQVNQQEVWNQLSRHIENIDENFQVAVNNLADIYGDLADQWAVRGLKADKLTELMTSLQAKDVLNRFYLVNQDGKLLFQWPLERSANDFIKKLIPTIGRRIYSIHNSGEQSLQNKVSDMMVESMTDSFAEIIGDSRAGFFRNFENLNQINEFWFANRRYYVYTSFVEASAGKSPNLMLIWHGTTSFSERYLLRQVRRNLALTGAQQPIRLAMVPRQRVQLPFPREFNKYPFATGMIERVLGTETQQYSIEEMDGESWLVTASPMKRVPGFVLFAMYPMQLIDQKIYILYLKILFVTLASCMIVLILRRFSN